MRKNASLVWNLLKATLLKLQMIVEKTSTEARFIVGDFSAFPYQSLVKSSAEKFKYLVTRTPSILLLFHMVDE